ncbi:MFS transporter [Campylobacter sp. CN_NE4]|nr:MULTISPECIES: MFS transporter [unclassified Campylobacter]MDA3056392.1 MFS transporter [Campylobacter sp. CN_NA1]MDA3065477.1 MFS transporter [Campylobacter sp. CN_NE4]MDA3068905.1 MFS transporter [Campylobacter sp. CN_NE3]MDA3082930.1 MFS transporter [Campylobacter sp. CN_EL2]MDA3084490.1 MFS transporter [Campylobacter sp. CN_NE1]
MIKYIALLRYSRNFRLFTIVSFICSFGVWFSHTGIFTLLIELGAPVWAITACAALAFVPNIFLAPINGIIVDKFRPKPLMVSMFLIETISVLPLIFIDSLDLLWLLFLMIFLRSGAGTLYFQAAMSMLPKILTKKNLKLANEMFGMLWSVSYTIGMGIAGIFIHYFGVKMAFIFDFVLYFVSFFILLNLNLKHILPKSTAKAVQMLKEGLIYLRKNPVVVHFMVLHAFVGVTSYDALVALLADYKYKGIMSAALIIGFINMARAAFSMVGQVVLSKYLNDKILFWLFIGQFVGIALWGVFQFNFYISFIGIAAAGFCITALWSYTFTRLQHHCDDEFLGRVIAYNDMLFFIVSAVTSAAIGFLFEFGVSLSAITMIMAGCFLVAGFYYKFVYDKYLQN